MSALKHCPECNSADVDYFDGDPRKSITIGGVLISVGGDRDRICLKCDHKWDSEGEHYQNSPNYPFIREIMAELTRAKSKFPEWPTDPIHALAIVGEEFGELQKEILQMSYEPHKTSKEKIRIEAIQLAAMALRFIYSLQRYDYAVCAQHSQKEGSAL